MIIFGTRGITYQMAKGQFACPSCGPGTGFTHRRVRRFFTLYFIPVIPLDQLGEYVECHQCRGTYKPEILKLDPAADRKAFEAEFHSVIRRVMIKMMLADGVIDEGELASIADISQKLTEAPLPVDRIRAEAALLEKDGQTVQQYLKSVRSQLNDRGKELVIRAALSVASADGRLSDDERLLLLQIGEAMEMTEAHLMGVMAAAADA